MNYRSGVVDRVILNYSYKKLHFPKILHSYLWAMLYLPYMRTKMAEDLDNLARARNFARSEEVEKI